MGILNAPIRDDGAAIMRPDERRRNHDLGRHEDQTAGCGEVDRIRHK